MDRILDQSHSKETFFYGLSRMLERASYYGLRAIAILYMITGSLKMDRAEALNIYALFTAAFLFSKIIGALLGDLLIGNRKLIIIGGIIQAIGAFSICIPSTTGLYLGLFLVVLGSGLYSPNMISTFGKSYLNKTKLLDAGFTLFYSAVNLGAFLGILFIGYVGEKYGWNIGFIIAGILMIGSTILVLISEETPAEETPHHAAPINRRVLNIAIVIILGALFWTINAVADIQFRDLQSKLGEISTLYLPELRWSSLSSELLLLIGVLASVFWTYFYSSQSFKLMIGFIFGAISFGILFLIPEIPSEQSIVLYLVSLVFLSLSEIHIGPIIYSVLTKYSNPKYLAIIVSLAFIPQGLITMFWGLFYGSLYENPPVAILVAMIAMTVLGVGLVVYHIMDHRSQGIAEKVG